MKTILTSDFCTYDIDTIGNIIKLYQSEKDMQWNNAGEEIISMLDHDNGIDIIMNSTRRKKISLNYSEVFELFLVLREHFKGTHLFEGEFKRVDM